MFEPLAQSLSSSADPAPSRRRPAGVAAPKRDLRKSNLTRIDGRSGFALRIRALVPEFTAALGEPSSLKRIKIQEAAELKAIAEQARGDWMREGRGSLDDIVRLEQAGQQGADPARASR